MSVGEVMKSTSTQVEWSGAVVVDGVFGVGLVLPDWADDFERLDDHLDPTFVFEYLSVFRF